MTSNPDLTVDARTPDATRSATPVPALGFVLAAAWLFVIAAWTFITTGTGDGPKPITFVEGVVNTTLLVAPPLLMKRIPGLLRRQAAPFLILAGVLSMSGWAIAIPYQWLEANVLVVYAIGWMRLRGRPPLVMFASLAAPILFLVCSPLSQTFWAHMTTTGIQADPVTGAAWRVAYSLLLSVLPVSIPVLVTGFAPFRGPSVQTAPSSTPGSVDHRSEWNAFAVSSLVCSLVLGSPTAIVFGHIALVQIRRTRARGAGLAAAGLVLGYLTIVAAVAVWLVIYYAFRNFTITF